MNEIYCIIKKLLPNKLNVSNNVSNNVNKNKKINQTYTPFEIYQLIN